jgi:hypothetical protein
MLDQNFEASISTVSPRDGIRIVVGPEAGQNVLSETSAKGGTTNGQPWLTGGLALSLTAEPTVPRLPLKIRGHLYV